MHLNSNAAISSVKFGAPLIFLKELLDILYDIRWWLILALVLIIADLWFGIRVAKQKGVEIRRSTAGRRTLNKFIDYVLYIVVGTSIGMAIGQPYGFNPMIVSCTLLALCYAFEVDSIYGHICQLHGFDKKFSIWKAIWLVITFRFAELKDFEKLNTVNENKNGNPE